MPDHRRVRPSGLSAIERQILLLVMTGLRGKEIAPLVNRSHDMVEKHISSARKKLGGIGRMEAARLVAAEEGVDGLQKLEFQNLDLLPAPEPPQDPTGQQGDASLGRSGTNISWPFEFDGRSTNEMTFAARWGWVLVLTLAVALLLLGLVTATGSLLEHLTRLL